jgi:archaellum biogenesis protein FlaJ (TadC family)
MMLEWIRGHELALLWMGTISLVLFFVTLILVPVLVVHIPSDYFLRKKRKLANFQGRYPVIRPISIVLKNILGIVFVLAGLAMLILPGQGIITILIGVMMLNFPGKRNIERRIVRQPYILSAINWMRAKAHKPALQAPHIRSKRRKGLQ